MDNFISEQITAVINGKFVNDVPVEIRDRVVRGMRVRLARHAGHSTVHNSDGTVTVTNNRLRITLPESEFEGREHVLTTAMRVLGHRSEMNIPVPEPTEEEIRDVAIENLTCMHLWEHCRYNPREAIMRMMGGHRMSGGMQADVGAARVWAHMKLRDNHTPHFIEAKQQILERLYRDRRHHEMISTWCQNWKIEIIGAMPTQIGLCKYRGEFIYEN